MAEENLPAQITDYNNELESLREREQVLVRQKMESETEFGHQRARFIELFKQKEDEFGQLKQSFQILEARNVELEAELKSLKEKIDEIKTESTIVEVSKDDEIARIQQQFQEESASFQHILKESVAQAYQGAATKYESERAEWLSSNEKLENELQELKIKLNQEKESTLSSLAKTLHKKVIPAKKEEPENLENSMKKAQEDIELLKSVVAPLEEEISQLKSELHLKTQQLSDLHSRESNVAMELDLVEVDGESKDLGQSLQTEQASRTDLEMYVKVLQSQKDALRNDNMKIRTNFQTVIRLLEQEKLEHDDLKRTWEMANEQFLESQRLLTMDIKRVESILTLEQQQLVLDLKKEDGEREKKEKRVDELREKLKREEEAVEKRKREGVILRRSASSMEAISSLVTPTEKELSDSIFSEAGQDDVTDDNKNDSLDCVVLVDSPTAEEVDLASSSQHVIAGVEVSKSSSPKHLSHTSHSKISQKSPVHKSNFNMKHDNSSSPGKRVVSDSEWEKLQIEVNTARDKLTKPCGSCNLLQEKHQQYQEIEKKLLAQIQTMVKHLDAERLAMTNHKIYIKELETSLHTVVEDSEIQIRTLHNKLSESEKFMKSFRDHFEKGKLELCDYLKHLSVDREAIQMELSRLQDENDSLVDKHAKKAQEMQEEIINFPNNLDEMQHILLKYREELITSRVTLEHNTEVLKSEISFLRSRLEAEQQERNNMEETLTQELSQLQSQIDSQRQISEELEQERQMRHEEQNKREKIEEQNEKNCKTIETLQFEVKQLTSVKTKLDKHIQELKATIHSLQIDLDNSEDVQRDFVKLSQTLQIQLEKIRAAETEVRWQHEEDIDDCPNCRVPFSVTKRKYHCRHCGQVFCSECLNKTVNSGPSMRPSKVCDVCHTMLVKDATPYFSTEPSHSQD